MLIDFLNNLLAGERNVESITYINSEIEPETKDNKGVRIDVYCKSDDGSVFIVEMQLSKQSHFVNRAIYYVARALVDQGIKGNEWDYRLCPVYGVFFMNFKLPELHGKFRTDAKLLDTESHEQVSNLIHMTFLQLPLFDKKEENECTNDFERWIYVLSNMEVLDRMPFAAKDSVFQRLADVCDIRKLTRDQMFAYNESLMSYRDYLSSMDTAFTDGVKEGLRQSIKCMLEDGKTISEIARILHKTEDEIKDVLKDM